MWIFSSLLFYNMKIIIIKELAEAPTYTNAIVQLGNIKMCLHTEVLILKSLLHHLLRMWLWRRHLTCLCLNFFLCKVGVMIRDAKGGGERTRGAGRENEALVPMTLWKYELRLSWTLPESFTYWVTKCKLLRPSEPVSSSVKLESKYLPWWHVLLVNEWKDPAEGLAQNMIGTIVLVTIIMSHTWSLTLKGSKISKRNETQRSNLLPMGRGTHWGPHGQYRLKSMDDGKQGRAGRKLQQCGKTPSMWKGSVLSKGLFPHHSFLFLSIHSKLRTFP